MHIMLFCSRSRQRFKPFLAACLTVTFALAVQLLAGESALSTPARLSTKEAEKLYRQEVFRSEPRMNPAAVFALSEETSQDLWARLQAQIFRVDMKVNNNPAGSRGVILIKNKQLLTIVPGFSGVGPSSSCLADLGGDGQNQFIIAFDWGSGIPYSSVAVVSEVKGMLCASRVITCRFGELAVKKHDDKNVSVELNNTSLGKIIRKAPGKFSLDLDKLPEKIEGRIDRKADSTNFGILIDMSPGTK
jgi:hypothetical protein